MAGDLDLAALLQGGSGLAFAGVVYLLLRAHLAKVEGAFSSLVASGERTAVAIERMERAIGRMERRSLGDELDESDDERPAPERPRNGSIGARAG